MRDVKHILLPTDFSENSKAAFPAAIALARQCGATLHLLHVVTPLPWPAQQVLEKKTFPALVEDLRRRSERRLRELAAGVGEIHAEIHVATGEPAEEVERLVAELKVGLLTISTKGHTGLKRFMLGSTAEKIVRTAPCPVLVVRPTPSSWDSITKIVVPTDFSELSLLAVTEAGELAKPHGARLLLVHVLEETDYSMDHVLDEDEIIDVKERTREAVRARLEELQEERVDAPVVSSIFIRDGVPSASIADLAEEENADLVVIATHGREGLARFVLGSTAERVVRIAPCSVLVVKRWDS